MSDLDAFSATDRLAEVVLIEGDGPPPSEAIEQERRVAIFELSEESAFRVEGRQGPYRLTIAADPAAIRLALVDGQGQDAPPKTLPAPEMAQLAGDYAALCEAYRDAVSHLPPAQIEALDQERRRAHDEASEVVARRLAPEIAVDAATARRLFTLICALGADLKGG